MASMIDYMIQTDAMLQKNRAQELENQNRVQQNQYYPRQEESKLAMQGAQTGMIGAQAQGQNLQNTKQGYINDLYKQYPFLAASSSLPAGFPGQLIAAEMLNAFDPKLGEMAKKKNELELTTRETLNRYHNVRSNSAGWNALTSFQKDQAALQAQQNGWTDLQIADGIANGDIFNMQKSPPAQYYNQNSANPSSDTTPVSSVAQGAAGASATPTQVAPVTTGALAQAMQNNNAIASTQADNTQSKLTKETTTSNIANQRAYNEIAGAIYTDTNQYVPSVQKYAGYGGGFDSLLDRAASGADGTSTQDYTNLLKFKQNAIALANETRRQLGGQATDKETELMDTFVSGDIWKETPEQVFQKWQNLGNLINITGKSLKNSMAQTQQGLGTYAEVPTSPQSISQAQASNVRTGYVAMRNPQGQMMQVPEGRAADAEKSGWQRG